MRFPQREQPHPDGDIEREHATVDHPSSNASTYSGASSVMRRTRRARLAVTARHARQTRLAPNRIVGLPG